MESVYYVLLFVCAAMIHPNKNFVRAIVRINVGGPMKFSMANYQYSYDILDRDKDVCRIFVSSTNSTFKFGGMSYSQITVCANGYIIPGVSGTPETAPAMVNGDDFDNPQTPVLAVGLIEIDRDDEMFDLDCILYANIYTSNPKPSTLCKAAHYAASLSHYFGYPLQQISGYNYVIRPSYGSQADKAGIVQQWIADGGNQINYASFFTDNYGVYGEIKSSLFSGPNDTDENFVPELVNNVVMRQLSPQQLSTLGSLTGDENFTPDWGYCFTWYKVGQPPEIIDHHNTFQLAIGCQVQADNAAVAEKCAAMFDYFEIGFFEQDGQLMRAGATGPGLIPFELPGSGNAATVGNLVNFSNINVTGIWVYEVLQDVGGELLESFDGSATESTAGPSTPAASTAGPSTTAASTAGPSTTAASTAGPSTPAASTAGPSTPAASTAGPSTPAASTAGPSTPAASTAGPSTPAASTAGPSTPAASTAGPSTPAASTAGPSTPAASTAGPSTPAASTAGPSTPAASTAGPSTPAASTAGPSTPAASTAGPSTPAASTAGPSTPAASTAGPSAPAASTAGPSTPAASTAGPSTPAASTAGPSTPAASTAVPSTPAASTAGTSTPAASTAGPSTPAASTAGPSTPAAYTAVPSTPAVSTAGPAMTTSGINDDSPTSVNVTLISVSSNSANLSVMDPSGVATMNDIVVSCQSDDNDGCNNFDYQENSIATVNAWVNVINLRAGVSYEITVNKSNYSGVPNTLHFSSTIFCTEPILKLEDFELTIISDTSITLDLHPNANRFDNGTVTAHNRTGHFVAQVTFDQSLFPVHIHSLPTNRVFNLTFQFSVGIETNCGNGVIRTTEPIVLFYAPPAFGCACLPTTSFTGLLVLIVIMLLSY
ncbi:uncharacterized protein LOC142336300 isoform X2 [Convolutriloba macropyga]